MCAMLTSWFRVGSQSPARAVWKKSKAMNASPAGECKKSLPLGCLTGPITVGSPLAAGRGSARVVYNDPSCRHNEPISGKRSTRGGSRRVWHELHAITPGRSTASAGHRWPWRPMIGSWTLPLSSGDRYPGRGTLGSRICDGGRGKEKRARRWLISSEGDRDPTALERLTVVTGRLTISHPLKKIESSRKAGMNGRAFEWSLNRIQSVRRSSNLGSKRIFISRSFCWCQQFYEQLELILPSVTGTILYTLRNALSIFATAFVPSAGSKTKFSSINWFRKYYDSWATFAYSCSVVVSSYTWSLCSPLCDKFVTPDQMEDHLYDKHSRLFQYYPCSCCRSTWGEDYDKFNRKVGL
jgi:hypothetical protein